MKPTRKAEPTDSTASRSSRTRTARESAIPPGEVPRWRRVMTRDASGDDSFVYGVKTTGVYSRPGSPAKRPRPEHVEFFPSAEAAEAAGYRPSRRSVHDAESVAGRHAALVAESCRHIEQLETSPTLEDLARRAGMSPYHFHRIFKAATGLTPKGYAAGLRARTLRRALASEPSVTDAALAAGFSSSSRLYARADDALGMRPAEYRRGGVRQEIRFAIAQCSLGAILVAESARGVCAILLGSDPDALAREVQTLFPQAGFVANDAAFDRRVAEVVACVEAPGMNAGLPLDVRGTAFQERVWRALRRIPPGSTLSYAELARRIGAPKAVRAVAGACAANRLAVLIPCHRVVASDGTLAGYRWGVERKQALLEREAKAVSQRRVNPARPGSRRDGAGALRRKS